MANFARHSSANFGTAFLGMIVGGAAFLVTGFAAFLTISQIEQRAVAQRAPIAQQQQVQLAHYLPRL